MNVLYLLPRVTHPAMRGELRHYNFLRRLGRSHRIALVGMIEGPVPDGVIDDFKDFTSELTLFDVTSPPRPVEGGPRGPARLALWRLARWRRARRGVAQMKRVIEPLLHSGRF